MKLGLILESDTNKHRKGTDHQVYEHIIQKLTNSIEIVVAGNTNKLILLEECGVQAETLFAQKCDYVAIIWDLMPTWGGKPCRKQDVEQICTKLEESQIDLDRIKLICIEPELESIFLVDGKALTAYKKQCCRPHPVEIFKGKKLAKNNNGAKTCISKYLERGYDGISEAIKIVEHIENYDKIANKHPSFKRLKEFVESLK
jgi:hypothetical protein